MKRNPSELLAWLAVLQFPLLYVTCTALGLAVYGMNFLTAAGYVYVAGAVVMIVAHLLMRRAAPPAWLLPIGALVTAAAYRPLHMGAWDQQSVVQAAMVSLAGLFSLAAARAGAEALRGFGVGTSLPREAARPEPPPPVVQPVDEAQEARWPATSGRGQVTERTPGLRLPPPGGRGPPAYGGPGLALASFGVVYLCAAAYPHVSYLACAVIMALAAALRSREGGTPNVKRPTSNAQRRTGIAGGAIFFLAMDLSQTVYDFGMDTRWTLHLAVAMPAAAAGAWLAGRGRARGAVVAAACANYIAAAVFPDYALHPTHAIVAGAGLGWALVSSLFVHLPCPSPSSTKGVDEGDGQREWIPFASAAPAYGRVAALIAAGMAASFAISANLSLGWLRLALPAAAGAVWLAKQAWKPALLPL